ncbi:unnamed protein product, partial [Polarella glacialis]
AMAGDAQEELLQSQSPESKDLAESLAWMVAGNFADLFGVVLLFDWTRDEPMPDSVLGRASLEEDGKLLQAIEGKKAVLVPVSFESTAEESALQALIPKVSGSGCYLIVVQLLPKPLTRELTQ